MQQQSSFVSGYFRQVDIIGDRQANPPIAAIVPIGASTLWRWVKEKKFPAPIKLSARVTVWKRADVLGFLAEQEGA